MMPRAGSPRLIGLLVSLAAVLSFLAALIHVWVMPEHWREWWGYGLFFALVAIAQGLLGMALLWWPRRLPLYPRRVILVIGIVANLVVILLDIFTRTVGCILLLG